MSLIGVDSLNPIIDASIFLAPNESSAAVAAVSFRLSLPRGPAKEKTYYW
jgi:hypothetical protein